MRSFGWVAVVPAVFVGCALTISYDGYQKAAPDASVDAKATGASAGVNSDANFGGKGGSGIAGGGTAGAGAGGIGAKGGAAGGGASGGAAGGGGTTPDPCAGKGEGAYCYGPICVGNLLTYSVCVNSVCKSTPPILCDPYKCENGVCAKSCSGLQDCAPGFDCNGSGQCVCFTCGQKYGTPGYTTPLCPGDSQTLWTNLVSCCPNQCTSDCLDPTSNPLQVCGGDSLLNPTASCTGCLTLNCADSYNACQKDSYP